jgi:tRNA pseudouridine55 synthase
MNHGFLLIDKNPGPTSHDIINALRKITEVKKIGHAGTLDPFASGLLFVAVGREATRELAQFVGLDKEYEAEIVLGVRSTTFDPEGELEPVPVPNLSIERLGKITHGLTGEINQIPPMHSAIKIEGQKLYNIARKGKEIKLEPRRIVVHLFEITDYNGATVHARIQCSSGTYVRALARDFGERLGTAAYLKNLRRVKIGNFSVVDAHRIEQITSENWKGLLKNF